MLPLEGIKIVDLTTVIFGPLASQVLADYGATVIKIETPSGDSTRYTGPSAESGMSSLFLSSNRNKESVVVDLKSRDGVAALHSILAAADVFMHNMRPTKLAALGFSSQELLQRYPKLVYADLLGFGSGGAYSGRPAYDDVIQGMTGIPDMMERKTGQSDYLPTIMVDKLSGHVAAHAILAAIVKSTRSGRGGTVEVPMFEVAVAFNLVENLFGGHFVPARGGIGYPRTLSKLRRPWKTSDGHICMLPYTDEHWRRFFKHCGCEELAGDPRFRSQKARTENIEQLLTIAADHVRRCPTDEWVGVCDELEIPAAAISRLENLLGDQHLQDVGFFQTIEDPEMGTIRFPGVPVLFDGQRPPVRMPPRLGEGNAGHLHNNPTDGA